MALMEERALDPREVRTDRGVARLYTLAPRVYVTVVSGHMDERHAELFEVYGAERIARAPGKLFVFHDWLEMTGYESACRKRMTEWSVKHLGSYQEVHLALRSKIVAMGVQVANLALGGLIHVETSRTLVELELRRVMRELGGASAGAPAARP